MAIFNFQVFWSKLPKIRAISTFVIHEILTKHREEDIK